MNNNKEIRIASLDLLRACAILFVLALHSLEFLSGVPDQIHYLFSYGWVGVDLFFVLSGFLIGGQSFNTSEHEISPIKKFLVKRLFRTLPLYYFVLFVYFCIKPMAGFPFNDSRIKYIFFIQNFFSPSDFVQSWSLCIEEQFYLLFPLIFFTFKKIPKYFWLLPGLMSTLIRLALYLSGTSANTSSSVAYNYCYIFFTHLDGISWGLFLAITFPTWSNIKNKSNFLYAGIISLLLTLIYIEPSNFNSKIVLSYQLLAISFSFILIGLYEYKNIPSKIVIESIAKWSYGIYLWNNLIARFIAKSLYTQNNFVKLLIYLFATILISAVTYYLIEKPTLNLRKRLIANIK